MFVGKWWEGFSDSEGSGESEENEDVKKIWRLTIDGEFFGYKADLYEL